MAEIYEIHQLFHEITENLSKLVVESDENKRLDIATIVQDQLDRGLREMRETVTRLHMELKSDQYAQPTTAKEAEPPRSVFDFNKIAGALKGTPMTGEILHFLLNIGYFNVKNSK